jgi:ornithine cyclodeaminase/alanine dehydrogenase-like protein (mu-crystallin family)
MTAQTIALTKADIASLAGARDYHDAVADAFRAFARGDVETPAPMEIHGTGGAFHVKGASMRTGGFPLAAVKVNANFPANPARGLPTIQGAILLSDASTGALLAVIDSIELTLRRTAAASAVALDLLAIPSASTLLICGCGAQARAHLEAIAPLRPIARVLAYDRDDDRAACFARDAATANSPPIEIVCDLAAAAATSDVVITVTTATAPLNFPDELKPGAFVAAVGADNPGKNEIAPALMAHACVVVDVADQCAVMGDLRAAIAAGAMARSDIRGELGALLTGATPGRRHEREVFIFDSTGAAFQDLAVAAMVYERARAKGIGAIVDLHR